MGHVAGAKADFVAVNASPGATAYRLYLAAIGSLSLNDRDAYRQAATTACERFKQSQDGEALDCVTWTCVLVPDAVKNYVDLIALARRGLAQQPTDRSKLLNLGAALYRAGRFEESKQYLTSALEAPSSKPASLAYVWYFLAMTNHQLGQPDEAQKWFAQAAEFTKRALAESKTDPTMLPWNRRLTLELFDAEAKALLATMP